MIIVEKDLNNHFFLTAYINKYVVVKMQSRIGLKQNQNYFYKVSCCVYAILNLLFFHKFKVIKNMNAGKY